MTLKTNLKNIKTELDKPRNEIDLEKLKSNLYMAGGQCMSDETTVPGALFNLFPEDMKRVAMLNMLQIVAQSFVA